MVLLAVLSPFAILSRSFCTGSAGESPSGVKRSLVNARILPSSLLLKERKQRRKKEGGKEATAREREWRREEEKQKERRQKVHSCDTIKNPLYIYRHTHTIRVTCFPDRMSDGQINVFEILFVCLFVCLLLSYRKCTDNQTHLFDMFTLKTEAKSGLGLCQCLGYCGRMDNSYLNIKL